MKKTFLAAALIALLAGCTQIDTGNIGVEKAFGKINMEPQPQGVYVTMFDDVNEYTTKEVSFQVNDLSPKTADNLILKDLDIDVYFKTAPACIPPLVVKYQGDSVYHSDIVKDGTDVLVVGYNRVLREAREATFNSVSKFNSMKAHTQRPEIGEEIRKNLQTGLDASDKGCFLVTTVNVRNMLTDPAIERAIQAQVAADQTLIRKQKEIEIAQKEAERQVAVAQGEADANKILNASLTPDILRIRLAEIERNTIIASSKAGNVIIHGNATPLVQVK